jgi:hypothetical protein
MTLLAFIVLRFCYLLRMYCAILCTAKTRLLKIVKIDLGYAHE